MMQDKVVMGYSYSIMLKC